MARRTVQKSIAGAALLAAAMALGMLAAACGGGGESTLDVHPISTVAAHPDIKVTKIAGGVHSPQFEANLAEEKTRNPGPASDLERLKPSAFDRPVAEYRVYSAGQAKGVEAAVTRLRADLGAGDVAAAKEDLLDAYDHYLRLGAAYGALGKLDEEIDGNPGRLPGGDHSPEFTGIHRIEMGLWEGESPAALEAPARYLAAKVRRLQVAVRQVPIGPLVYATRAHEILEDAQRDMLSNVDAPWSGAGLRATDDALAATEFVIHTLRPVLAGRDSTVEPVEVEMARFREVLNGIRKENGGRWPTLEALTPVQHERVDGGLGSLLERLSAVPGALEVKRPRPVPTIAEQKADRNGGEEDDQ
ncbi:MAG TPA: EfeM/EfeO family lipoprotein [Solirubrobacterales bacterium]|nr:EfeM/EfeO family lipoprotein [Solirubrobacterales bacterium]